MTGLPYRGHPLLKLMKGLLLLWCLLLTSLFSALFVVVPLLPVAVLRPALFRWILDHLMGFWVVWPCLLMEFLFGSQISIGGDLIRHDEPAIIIMNHRTRLDWLFFWSALYKMDPWLLSSEKISMKKILKYIPGAGWGMQSGAYIFLDRHFEEDKAKLTEMIEYYSRTGNNYQLLFFPEGTDKCPRATERSRLHSVSKGLDHYEQVLHPRTTGFVHVMKTMRQANYIKNVYDVTIGYPENFVQSEADLILRGDSPSKVHYQVQKYDQEALPEDDIALAEWLKDLWKKKELRLNDYYSKPVGQRLFDPENLFPDFQMNENKKWMQWVILGVWIMTTCFWTFALFQVSYILHVSAVCILIFLGIEKFYGGLEWMSRHFLMLQAKKQGIDN